MYAQRSGNISHGRIFFFLITLRCLIHLWYEIIVFCVVCFSIFLSWLTFLLLSSFLTIDVHHNNYNRIVTTLMWDSRRRWVHYYCNFKKYIFYLYFPLPTVYAIITCGNHRPVALCSHHAFCFIFNINSTQVSFCVCVCVIVISSLLEYFLCTFS